MAASNVIITRKTDGASVEIPAYKFFDALKFSAKLRPEDDSIEIDSVKYIRSSMNWASGGSFASATWDVLFDINSMSPNTRYFNSVPAGATVQDVVFNNYICYIDARLGRNGFASAVTKTITDSNALFTAFTASGTIGTDSSNGYAKVVTKALVLPGTYGVIVSCTDGAITKSRTFNIVVSAYPAVAAGNGWL